MNTFSCVLCAGGKYSSTNGASLLKMCLCEPGKFSTQPDKADNVCEKCNADKYSTMLGATHTNMGINCLNGNTQCLLRKLPKTRVKHVFSENTQKPKELAQRILVSIVYQVLKYLAEQLSH